MLIEPTGPVDIVSLLRRCIHAHPNVVASIGITGHVRVVKETLGIALLYRPVQNLAPATRDMVVDPSTAWSRVMVSGCEEKSS